MPQFWAGFCDGKIDVREVDTGFGGFGTERKVSGPIMFTTRKEARREYEDVRKVEIRVVSRRRPSRKETR